MIIDYSKPSVKEITITPDQAAAMLRRNLTNRRVDKNQVQQYADDMSAGRWKNVSMIIFDRNGCLIDGQHRLMALVKAQATIPFVVKTGAPPEAIDVIDSGKKRSAADALTIRGVRHATIIASVAKRAIVYERDGLSTAMTHFATVSHAEIAEYVAAHEEELSDIAVQVSTLKKDLKGYMEPSTIGFILYVLSQVSDRGYEFLQSLTRWNPEGSPSRALQNKLSNLRSQGIRGHHAMRLQANYTFLAWNKWLAGAHDVMILRVASNAKSVTPKKDPLYGRNND